MSDLELNGPPLLFVDLDGTVRKGADEPPLGIGRFVNGPDDVEVFPEAVTMIRRWRDAGGLVHGITNQAGIALGYMTEESCSDAIRRTMELAGNLLDEVWVCPHAPDAGCFCRKPLPGLILAAVSLVTDQSGASARSRCLMVGDRDEDAKAAMAAGVPFEDAATWRARAHAGGDH